MWFGVGRREMYAGFLWGNLKERDHLEEVDIDGGMILKWLSKMLGGSSIKCRQLRTSCRN
jgi:hypothetical protein